MHFRLQSVDLFRLLRTSKKQKTDSAGDENDALKSRSRSRERTEALTFISRRVPTPDPRLGEGVLGISSDGDDGRIFLGLKFSIPVFFWVA